MGVRLAAPRPCPANMEKNEPSGPHPQHRQGKYMETAPPIRNRRANSDKEAGKNAAEMGQTHFRNY